MAGTTSLPQFGSDVFLTDGGIETDLIFNRGIELPDFASFVLHDDPAAEAVVRDYFLAYLQIAATEGFGLVLETLTWRASLHALRVRHRIRQRIALLHAPHIERAKVLLRLRSRGGTGLHFDRIERLANVA